MSTEIDNRVVAMKFDNKQFESGVSTSLSTLDKLKSSLNLEGAAKGLDGISAAANRVSFDGMGGGIEAVKVKFSALQVAAVAALTNITNSAMNAGKNLIKSLTLDPVTQGFHEYETQMNAIQTILANTSSKGTTLTEVKDSLAELNTYSDKTIYNFTEMAKNIGTFTAAGVALKPATAAIKGIANLAAVSGSTSEQASTAMYQLSQAMASGTVKLMDWNSVVNAGMGGEVFQNSLKETARVHGINIDQMIKNEGSFRETLHTGWLSTSILTETLNKFTGDLNAKQLAALGYSAKQIEEIIKMGKTASDAATKVKTFSQLLDTLKEAAGSGWALTWQTLFGDFEEAKVMFTNVSNVLGGIIGASADARNNMLKGWKDLGGRTVLIDAIAIAFNNVMDVAKAVTSAFKEIFPPMTSKQLYNLTVGLKSLMSGLTLSKGGLDNLKSTFKGVFAIMDIGVDIIKFVASALGLVVSTLFPVTGGLLTVSGAFGNFSVMLHDAIESSNIFGKALGVIATALNFVKGVISPYVAALKEWITTSTLIEDIMDNITLAFAPYIASLKEWLKTSTLLQDVNEELRAKLSNLIVVIKGLWTSLSSIDFNGTKVSSEKLGGAFGSLSKTGDKLKESFSGVDATVDRIKSVFEKVGSVMTRLFGPAVQFVIDKLRQLTLSDVGAVLAGGGLFMIAKSIKDAMGSFKNVTEGFISVLDGVSGSLEAFQTKLKADALFKIAMAIGLLAVSIIALSLINVDALTKALLALTIIFAELAGVIWLLQQATITAPGISTKLIALGLAVSLMASAVRTLSEIDPQKLTTGIQGLTAVLTLLALFVKFTSGASVQTSVISMFGIASAVMILAKAVEKFGNMDEAKMSQGIQGVVTSLMALALFIRAVGSPERMFSVGIGISAIALAVNAFAGAVALFGIMPLENLKKGVSAIAALLLSVAIAMRIMPNSVTVIAMGVALNLMATSLYLIAGAIAILGNMDVLTLNNGLKTLATALFAFAIAARTMNGTTSAAVAMLGMVLAINMLIPAIAILGNMEIKTIAIALGALAGVFIVLGLAGLALTPLAPIILTLAASIGLIGIGVYALGGGLILFAAGLAALAAGGAVFVAAFVGMVMAVLNLIPTIAQKLGEGVGAFAQAIKTTMPQIMDAVKAIATGLIQAFTDLIVPVVEAAIKFIMALLLKIAEYIQPLIDSASTLVVGFIYGIISNLPRIMEAAIKFVNAFLDGIAVNLPSILSSAINLVLKFILGVASKLPAIVDSAFKLIITFINGIADAIRNNNTAIYNACANMIGAIVESVIKLLPTILNIGIDIIRGVIKGIWSMAGALGNAAKEVISGAVDGVKKFLGIHSPSKVFAEIGEYSGQGFVNGLSSYTDVAAESAKQVGKGAVNAMSEAIAGISDIVNGNIDSNPVIRPVLDLSDVMAGTNTLSNLLDKNQSISAISRSVNTNSRSTQIQAEDVKSMIKNELGKNVQTNQNGPLFSIENFVNNRAQDIESLATEFAFYMKQKELGGSRV